MYNRNCPDCNKILECARKKYRNYAEKNSIQCKSCSKKGKNHPMYGKFPSKETRQKMSENSAKYWLGKHRSEETKLKISKNGPDHSGKNNPMYGKPSARRGVKLSKETRQKISDSHIGMKATKETRQKMSENHVGMLGKRHSENTKQKMSASAIKRIKNGTGQIFINYNSESCKIIDEYGKQHGYNFQHAENGGEFHVPNTRYFVDGYDKKRNLVLEIYENFHKYQKEYDKQRKKLIIDCLGCKFIEIKEWENYALL